MDRSSENLYLYDMNTLPHIATFSLFGETKDLADLLHLETIEARSTLYQWSLAPHRHARLHQILLVEHGQGVANIDGTEHEFTAPCVINLPCGVVHGFQFDIGTNGWVVSITADLLTHCLDGDSAIDRALQQPAVTAADSRVRQLLHLLAGEYAHPGPARAQILRGLVTATAGALVQLLSDASTVASAAPEHQLLRRFQTAVEEGFRRRKKVSDYASDLAISPTHLNRICRRTTGQSASQLITERMVQEARRLLIYSTLSAAEIAYELGFTDPAHFSRVFARETGQPPRRFRQAHGAGLPPDPL
ncbi:helix-turn-helix domain-containing protein [Phaeobacter sp.]|uniref:helix-turn-helix domain-containing protein n=1 Tax=Phaeobacter sp. TaxID=1902409 RepID=UPI0025DADE71|nr:helix-turn-helix domain-containing protein [Phaeobacter sp.]